MATQLLLIEDVEDLGRSGDIVSVKEGYSRNYLIPRGMAVKADKAALRRQAALQEARLKQAVQDKKDADLLAEKLKPLAVEIVVKTDPEGNMYGSVSAQDLVKLVSDSHGIALEKSYFKLKQAIKKLGSHEVELTLKEGVPASFKLTIRSDDATVEAAALERAKKEEVAIIAALPGEEAAPSESE